MTDDQETTIAAIRTKGYTLASIINYPHRNNLLEFVIAPYFHATI